MSVNHHQTIIETKDLSVFYGTHQVLKNINLHIHQGDYLGIVGPNGSGKSTLIKAILGLTKITSGEISIYGVPQTKFKDWSKIGYVAQKVSSFDTFFPITVQDVVSMGRIGSKGLFKPLNSQDKVEIDNALEQVDMLPLRNQLIGELSGGQQQRVFIARSLAQRPQVLFLDEPTSGIDQSSQDSFYKLLKDLNQRLNITLVLISHDIDVVTKQVTEIACINQTLVYHGNSEGFVTHDVFKKLYSKELKHLVHTHDL